MKVVAIGEVLWDIFPEREELGGAPLNFAVNCARLGESVSLVSSVGGDIRGIRALEKLRKIGVDAHLLKVSQEYPTGTAVVKRSRNGEAFEIVRPAAFDALDLSDPIRRELSNWNPDWVYFGTLAQTEEERRRELLALHEALITSRFFYDLNLREGHWNLQIVEKLSCIADIVKMNEGEARMLHHLFEGEAAEFSLEQFSRDWVERYGNQALCITRGPQGAFLLCRDKAFEASSARVQVADTVGAGDAFSAAFLHAFHRQWSEAETLQFANVVAGLVASRSGATPEWSMKECAKPFEQEEGR